MDGETPIPGTVCGMLSLIPRVGEMLRINGRVASIEGGDLRIVVEGCYGHYAKALIRAVSVRLCPPICLARRSKILSGRAGLPRSQPLTTLPGPFSVLRAIRRGPSRNSTSIRCGLPIVRGTSEWTVFETSSSARPSGWHWSFRGAVSSSASAVVRC